MSFEHIMTLAEALALEAAGQPHEGTRQVRVRNGIYVVRNRPGRYLVRIRVPAGIISADQLTAIAGLAEAFADPRIHLTTRQGIELYGVEGSRVVTLLERLGALGLTTRNTGGNVLRGVVCCAHAGLTADEPFDVTPYALAVEHAFRDDARFQRLPRKMKIAFEGCTGDHVHTAVSDIGLRAAVQQGQRGFRITIGGGLGAAPRLGALLEPFTPADQLFATIAAILTFFDAHGNRSVRAKARLKWLLADWGADRVIEAILQQRAQLAMPTPAGLAPPPAENPPPGDTTAAAAELAKDLATWQATSVRPQRQPGLVSVGVRIPLGDFLPDTLRALAEAARRFAGGVRLSIEQNVLLRSVPEHSLPALFNHLRQAGLASGHVERLIDITRCAGRATCVLALTDSRAAADLVASELEPDLARNPALQGQRIRVSGCANSCAHHHWADIGLFGLVRRVGDQPAPHYALVLGGGTDATPLGVRVAEVPARRAGAAVRRVLTSYLEERQEAESFAQFANRYSPDQWSARLADLSAPREGALDPDLLRDAGSDEVFAVKTGGPATGAPAGDC